MGSFLEKRGFSLQCIEADDDDAWYLHIHPLLRKNNNNKLIRDSPLIEPFEMPPLCMAALHAEHDRAEKIEKAGGEGVQGGEKRPLDASVLPVEGSRHPIEDEAHGEDGKVQRGVVMMHVRDARHGHEGEVVQKPADHRVQAGIVDLVDFRRLQLLVAALPAYEIPARKQAEDE